MSRRWLALGVMATAVIALRPALCKDLTIPEEGMIHVNIPNPPPEPGPATPSKPEDRVAKLEAEVQLLKQENASRRDEIRVLKGQVNALMTQIQKLGERLNAVDGKGGGPRG